MVDGTGISVDFDGRLLVVEPTTPAAKEELGTSRLSLFITDISRLSLKGAGMLRGGRLSLTMHDGSRHQLAFSRDQQPHFTHLYKELRAAKSTP
ncbi:hypothetical protein GCM10022247_63080 [Allokutzneria multivorans]|uniref:Uncharacterized protein n=1 Tax=Allokutzneria multivorans TaxID=1142134 RepID=A0ABP7TQF0_9PSEU